MTQAVSGLDAQMQRLEGLLAQLASSSDPAARVASRDVVALLLDLHRDGLKRLLDLLDPAQHGKSGAPIDVGAACRRDPLLTSVLLLHGLHPTPLRERATAAVRTLAGVVAVTVDDTADGAVVSVQIELQPPHSPGAQVTAVEEALMAAVPDAAAVRLTGSAAAAAAGLVTLGKRAS